VTNNNIEGILPAAAIKRISFFSRTMVLVIMAGVCAGVFPVHAGIGEGTSGTTIIDTEPPTLVVDQFPPFTIFLGGDTVPFHWQSGDSHPSNVPEHFTATVWIEEEVESSIIYYPDTDDYNWDWTAPEISSANVYLEVQARDAFGNLASATTNNFTVLSSVTNVPDAPGKLHLATPAPNPFNPATKLAFNLPEPGQVALTVYDTRGRRVRTLLRGHRQGGEFEALWNGRDDQGRGQPGGVYLFVLEYHGSRQSGKISQKAVLIP
jgi:hypothetical protein